MDDPKLQDYIAVIRRQRRVVLAALLVSLAVAAALSFLQTPRYRAEAELMLRPSMSEQLLVDRAGQVRSARDSERELNNEIERIESRAVRDAVAERYDGPLDVDDVAAEAPASDSTDVVLVHVTATDRAAAAELVNLYAETYVEVRRQSQIDELLAASEDIQSRLDSLREEIAEVSQPLDEIEARIAALPADSPERARLEDQRTAVLQEVLPQLSPLQSREASFRAQLEQLEATQDLTRTGGATILTAAEEPTTPVAPRPLTNLVVGGLVGLVAGIALAFLRDHLDDSVGSKEECEQVTSLPTLGVIPEVDDPGRTGELPTVVDPLAPSAEAYRLLRTSVRFLGVESEVTTVLVTSPAASEGKTVTAANLAVVLAQSGERVLLVGADLRRPRTHELFGARQAPGLTTVLLEDADPGAATFAVEEVPGLHVMPPGPTPPNPAELLDSQRARDLLEALAHTYDRVVVDSPPVLPVTDAQVLSRSADAVLLVIAFRETSRRGLGRALELLGQVAAPVVGTVLNLVPAEETYGGTPYRYEAYRSRSERRRRRQQAAAPEAGNGAPKHAANRRIVLRPGSAPARTGPAPHDPADT